MVANCTLRLYSLVLAHELTRLRVTNILHLPPPFPQPDAAHRPDCPRKGDHDESVVATSSTAARMQTPISGLCRDQASMVSSQSNCSHPFLPKAAIQSFIAQRLVAIAYRVLTINGNRFPFFQCSKASNENATQVMITFTAKSFQ